MTGSEGQSLDLVGTFSDPGVLDTHTAVVQWSDGSSTPAAVVESNGLGTVTASHIFADNSIYPLRLEVIDNASARGSLEATATITNVAPIVTPPADQTTTEGSMLSLDVATFIDPGFTNPAAGTHETFTATIDWGDGTPIEAGVVSATQGSAGILTAGSVSGEHIFANDGDYEVEVTVTDDDGGAGSASFVVTVENVAPTIIYASPVEGDEGGSVDLTADFTDPGILDTHHAAIDWGDGTQSTAEVIEAGGLGTILASHVYADDRPDGSPYVVTVQVWDNAEDSDFFETTATIHNVAPTLTADYDFRAVAGADGQQLAMVVSGSVTDPGFDRASAGTVEQFTAAVDWGDGSIEPVTLSVAPGSENVYTTGSFFTAHVYQQGGIYSVSVTLQDDDGGEDSEQFSYGVARIDVKSTVNPQSNGVIPVQILSDPSFDATRIDPLSLRFGPGGASEDHGQLHGSKKPFSDVMTHFDTQESGIRLSDTVVFLRGMNDGVDFVGMDVIRTVPPQSTKFYVADALVDTTFAYASDGSETGSFALPFEAQNPRGVTSNAAGDTLWTIDAVTHTVAVQSSDGRLSGTWTAGGVVNPQGIATDGTDIWIVDAASDTVSRFAGAAQFTSGVAPSTDSFRIQPDNQDPSGLATDGQKLWITDDMADAVFVYETTGEYVGRWSLDPANAGSSGITNDPTGESDDLWIVDRQDLVVYHYRNAATLIGGSAAAANTFPLAAADIMPEGIADPLEPSSNVRPQELFLSQQIDGILGPVQGAHVSPDGSKWYAVAQNGTQGFWVHAIDPTTRSITATIQVDEPGFA